MTIRKDRPKLIALAGKGLKGIDVDEDLSPVQVYIGPNGAGKTARLQYLELGLRGVITGELGRKVAARPSGIMGLATDPAVKVEIDITDGRKIRRKVKGTPERATFGKLRTDPAPGVFAPAFDLQGFLELSDDKKREAFFHLLPVGAVSEAEILQYLREQFQEEERDPAVAVAMKALIVGGGRAAAGRGLDALIEWSRNAYTEANDRARTAARLLEVTVEPAKPARTLDQIRADVKSARAALEDLARREADTPDPGPSMADLAEAAHQATAAEGEAAECSAELQAAEAELQATPAVDAAPVGDLEEARKDLQDGASGLLESEGRVRALERARNTGDRFLETLATLEGDCPTCRRELTEEARQAARASVTEEIARVEEELDQAEGARQLRRDHAERTRRRIMELEKATEEGDRARQARATLAARVEALRARVKPLEATARTRADALARLQERARDSEGDTATVRAAILAGERESRERELGELDAELDHAKAAAGAEATLQEAEAAVVDATARLEAVKLIREWAGPRGLLGERLAEVVGPLEARINAIAGDGDARFRLRLADGEGRPAFDFGLEIGGVYRSWRTLSGGEFARTLAAFLAACLEAAGVELRILLLDSLERISEPNRTGLLLHLARLVADGVIDQVVAASSEPVDVKALEATGIARVVALVPGPGGRGPARKGSAG